MRLFRRFKSIKSEASFKSYREVRNEYQRALDKAKDDYRKSLADSKTPRVGGIQLRIYWVKGHLVHFQLWKSTMS